MIPHQYTDKFFGFSICPKPLQHPFRNFCAALRMPVKMSGSMLVYGKAVRLSEIMEQQRPADSQLWSALFQCLQRMLPRHPDCGKDCAAESPWTG